MILLDTNIIIYSKQSTSQFFTQVTTKLQELQDAGNELVICNQVLYEFYRFATSPLADNRGLGLTPAEAVAEIDNLIDTYLLVNDNCDMPRWKSVMADYEVRGKKSHDARLVTTMLANDIERLYTLNTADFTRFAPIITITI